MDWKKYLIEHKDQQFTVYFVSVWIVDEDLPFGVEIGETDNYGYLDEDGKLCEKINKALITTDPEKAVRKMNLMAHLIQNHLQFNVAVTYTVEAWNTADISKKSAKRLEKMPFRDFVLGEQIDDEVATRTIGYNFRDLTGSVLVRWKWVNYIQGTREYLGLEVVSDKDDIHDESLLVVSPDERYENRTLVLKHDDRYLGYANGNINELVEEELMDESYRWVNPEDISLYFMQNEGVMIFDDLSSSL